MKKFFALCASMLLICASFTGCGNDKNESSVENSAESSNTTEEVTEDITEATKETKRADRNEMDSTDNNSSLDDNGDGIIDGIESAGEDIIDGAGDAAEDIIDGITGDESSTSTDNKNKDSKKSR